MERHRPRVSRETRLLLGIVLLSVSTLWVLARIRFPDRPPTPNPVPPVLAQLAPPPPMEAIASSLAELQPRIEQAVIALGVGWPPGRLGEVPSATIPALRFRDDLAMTILDGAKADEQAAAVNAEVVGHDPVSGLAVVRVAYAAVPALSLWSPMQMQYPRFLVAADVSHDGTSLRPVFIGSLYSVASPAWSESVWGVPLRTDLSAGTFMFTVTGSLAGVAIEQGGRPAIVPAETLIAAADRLLQGDHPSRGRLGVQVQALTSPIAAATGASAGVVVTWVDPQGPAAGELAATDIIEAIDDQPMTMVTDWGARIARLAEGEAVALKVRRRGDVRDVHLTAAPRAEPARDRPLGLTMRAIGRTGVEVVRVDPGSAAARAGLQAGDVITVIGDVAQPAPAQVGRVFSAAADDRPVVVAVTRGSAHHVLTLEKKW